MTEALVFDHEIDAPPAKVWRALTEPALRARWLAPGELTPETGTPLRLDDADGEIAGEVLAAEPGRLLRLAWRQGDGEAAVDSVVTFTLLPTIRGGTFLRVVHAIPAAPAATTTRMAA